MRTEFAALALAAALLLGPLAAAGRGAAVEGRLVDVSGGTIARGTVTLRLLATGTALRTRTDGVGSFRFEAIGQGDHRVTAAAEGFAESGRIIRVPFEGVSNLEIVLHPATLAQGLAIYANRLVGPEVALREVPGAFEVVDSAMLAQSRVFTFDEALRKVTGVYVRGEEGFGLRPNIGIRGLNPTRSTKVLLLEDGVPIAYAPYGDNASYYHPPVDRFDSIEVIKGSGQVLYGPSTVAGVINYITPPPPDRGAGSVTLTGGSLDYFNGHIRYGNTIGRTGFALDYMRKQGDGSRENTHFGLNDVTGKVLRPIGARQTVSLKMNYYGEDSQLTYSGLRWAEWLENPRANPFRNDAVDWGRFGGAIAHTYILSPNAVLSTNLYGQRFARDWWRQSSNSNQRPNDAADPLCGGMANLHTTCGNEGRLRRYATWGFDPKVRAHQSWGGLINEFDFGFRGHFETQDRRQENGESPVARSGRVVELNERQVRAWSGFLQNRFVFGRFGITPGVRLERIRLERQNRLLDAGGHTSMTQWIPGVGATFSPSGKLTVFGGAHRGFAPPRVEDVINNTTGGVVELDSELSWNYEAGMRLRADHRATLEATFFRLDFENQIVPASVAGGTGATLTSAGETTHQGVELSGRYDFRSLFQTRHSGYIRGAYTWLPVARFEGRRYSSVSGFADVSVTGNRIPYAPSYMLNAIAGYLHPSGLNAMVEGVFTGGQFGDDLNTWAPSPDGQRGRVPGNVIWNATLNYPIEGWRSTVFVAVKNLGDRLYIVDRARGVLPGMPRLVQIGLRVSF
ncbi:MAG: TonB-dependent receptor [Bryobacteraceae bacterium]|nr:TonB-dependent receptor [Bryobacteraceae bacterium]